MKSLRELETWNLEVARVAFLPSVYEVRAAGETVAALRCLDLFCWRAEATSADGTWILERHGFLRFQVVVRDPNSEVARFEKSWFGGTLRFSNGSRFEWERTRFFPPEYVFRRDSDVAFVVFERRLFGWRSPVRFAVSPQARQAVELPIALLLGLYLTLLESRRH